MGAAMRYQPQGLARISPTNPIARGLVLAFQGGSAGREVVSGAAMTGRGSAQAVSLFPGGKAYDLRTVNAGAFFSAQAVAARLSGDQTVVFDLVINGAPSGSGPSLGGMWMSTAQNDTWLSVDRPSTDELLVNFRIAGGVTSTRLFNIAASTRYGQRLTVAVSVTRAAPDGGTVYLRVAANGTMLYDLSSAYSGTGSNLITPTGTEYISIGSESIENASRNCNALQYGQYHLGRVVNTAEVAALSANPWQLFDGGSSNSAYQAAIASASAPASNGTAPTTIGAGTGTEASTGQPAALVTPTNIATGTGTEASTGQAAGLVLPTAINAGTGTEASTGQGASIATPTAVNANTGTETNAGQGASVSVGPAIGASTGTETSAGQPAALVLPTNTAANTGAETSTGRAAGLVLPTAINAGTGTEASAGQPAALVTPTNIAAGTGTEASTGQHATVSTPAGALVPTDINASTGAETSTGQHATVSAGTIIPARTGAEDSTGQSAQVSGITPPAPRAIDPDMVYSSERRGYTYPFGGTMDFPDVIAGDVRTLTFNYSSELPAGAEIRSAVPSVRLHAGVDPAPGHIVVGQPIVQGSVVTVQVQPMIAGCSYWPRVKATFSDGQEITYPNPGEGSLRVVA